MRIRDWSSDVCSSDLLGAGHYPIIVGVHAALLVVLFLAVDRETPILWAPFVLFLLLQVARLWVIASLGRYWTTRIIAVPHVPDRKSTRLNPVTNAHLVCRLLLEKKNTIYTTIKHHANSTHTTHKGNS